MNKISKNFFEYGLGQYGVQMLDENKNKINKIIKRKNWGGLGKLELKNMMLNAIIDDFGGLQISHRENFRERLEQENIVMDIKDWEMELIIVENFSYLIEPKLEFGLRMKFEVDKILDVIIKRKQKDFQEQNDAFFLESLFDKESAKKKLMIELDRKIEKLNEQNEKSNLLLKLQNNLIEEIFNYAS